ncbi:MAG: rsmB, partial [Chlamydiia bacterium]|nr:rsmB [Chlamydiia bacterium]
MTETTPLTHSPYRENHLLQLLEEYDTQDRPLDYFVSCYFRDHKSLGSKDRGYIAESIYRLIRWKGLYDYLLGGDPSWESRYKLSLQKNPEEYFENKKIPLHTRVSFPENLFQKFVESHGEEKAIELCFACNDPAPTAIRVNTNKIDREALLKNFKAQGYVVSLSKESPTGIIFHKKINFFSLTEFKDGFFEVQDEASQLVAQLLPIKTGQQVLDFCAGAGGKALAFADKLQGTGQIFLHDIRQHALYEARKRLKRAGIQNSQILHSSEEKKLQKLKKQ